MKAQRLIRRLSAPFAALLLFGAAGIVAMIVALASQGPAPVSRSALTPRAATPSPSPSGAASPPSSPASEGVAAVPPPGPSPASFAVPPPAPTLVPAPAKHHVREHQADR